MAKKSGPRAAPKPTSKPSPGPARAIDSAMKKKIVPTKIIRMPHEK